MNLMLSTHKLLSENLTRTHCVKWAELHVLCEVTARVSVSRLQKVSIIRRIISKRKQTVVHLSCHWAVVPCLYIEIQLVIWILMCVETVHKHEA